MQENRETDNFYKDMLSNSCDINPSFPKQAILNLKTQ